MTAQQQGLPTELSSSDVEPARQRRVIRRASQLCLRAEPHADESPCHAHLNEANRQLLGLPG